MELNCFRLGPINQYVGQCEVDGARYIREVVAGKFQSSPSVIKIPAN